MYKVAFMLDEKLCLSGCNPNCVQLMDAAKALKLSQSAILEDALSKAEKVAKYERWQMENKQAIAEYDQRVEAQGTFSENIRQL
jgi:antitoxin CcdA